MAERTYEERIQDLRSELPQGGTKSGKATTSGPTPTDTDLIRQQIADAERRAKDRAAAEAAGVLDPLRPEKPAAVKSTYKSKTPADAVPRFIEALLGEGDEEIIDNWAEFNARMTESMGPNWEVDMKDTLDRADRRAARAALVDAYGAKLLEAGPDLLADDLAFQAGLETNPDVNVDWGDPQAIADAADDHAAQYIYEDTPAEDVPDAAAIDYEREQDNPHRAVTYTGDGPGGKGTVYFYEMTGGGGQRGYWVRDDGSVVNVTNILLPPSDAR